MTATLNTYSKYKNNGPTWFGVLPDEWDIVPMRSLFKTNKELVTGKADQYLLLSLTMGGVKHRDLSGGGKNPTDYETYQEFKKNDLVICLFDYDVTPRTIGYVEEDGMMTGAYTRLIPQSNTDSKYFYYLYLFLDQRKELLHQCTGLRNSISKPIFWSLQNPKPNIETQKNIADFLDEKTKVIDELVFKKEKIIELLREKRAALITHAVTKGLDPTVNMKDSGLEWVGKMPENWKIKKVKEIFNINRGRVIAKTELDDDYKYPVYSSQTDNNGILGMINTYDYDDELLTWTTDGAKAGTVFKRIGKFSCTNVCGMLVLKNKIDNLNYLLYSVQHSATENKRPDTNGAKIMSGEMKVLKIVYAPLEIQKQIADYLDTKTTKMDKVITLIESQIYRLKEYRSSLIYSAVTGKIKV